MRKKVVLISNEFYDVHRGEKDFYLANYFSANESCSAHILHSGKLSLLDQAWIDSAGKPNYHDLLPSSDIGIWTYQGIRMIRTVKERRTAYLIPNPFAYLVRLFQIRPDTIIDVVYTTLTPRSFLNFVYARLFGKKMILIDPGDEGRNKCLIPGERKVYDYATKIVVTSNASKERISSKYGVAETKISVAYKMISTETFKFSQNDKSDRCTIGYVGRFLREKGFGKYIQLVNSLPENIRCMAIGHNEDDFGLPRRLEVYEPVPNEKLAKFYSEIDILVLPDLSGFRSYPTVVQEALLCGCEVWVGNIDQKFFPKPELVNFYETNHDQLLRCKIAFLSKMTRSEKIQRRQRISDRLRVEMEPSRLADYLSKVVNA